MDTKLKADWVAALRSGKYRQTRNTLKDDCAYCCLGVLNAVAGRQQAYGLSEAFGIPASEIKILATMNDRGMKSFVQIADYIEANL